MSKAEQHEFEKKMLNDPLLMDAVEGFEELPDWGGAKSLNAQFGNSSSTAYIFVALVSFILVVGIFYFLKSDFISEESASIEVKQSPENIELNENALEKESDAGNQIIEVSNTDSSVSVTYRDQSDLPREEEHFLSYRETTIPEPMQTIEPGLPNPTTEQSAKEARARSNKIYHIKEYKVADYREIRTEDLLLDPNELSGTPANENLHERIRPNDQEIRSITYVDFLDQTITLFALSEYEEALKNCDIILENYPEDVNAQFYGGMSALRLQRFEKASKLLSQATVNIIATFEEEALFYFASSQYETGELDESIRIMKEIANSQSFYNSHASKWLNKRGVSEQRD
jgi:tetratricopeptide (TPR) repeat protein